MMKNSINTLLLAGLTLSLYFSLQACSEPATGNTTEIGSLASLAASASANDDRVRAVNLKPAPGKAIAAFAEGCFWHSEIIFESLPGVDSVVSGYAGGKTRNPGYEEVGSGNTGHAETALIYYDPKKIFYTQLLNAFFLSHDPSQLNRQGNDVGTQYRSVAFYQTPEEKDAIKAAIAQTQRSNPDKLIVTQVMPLTTFYRAEGYHQDYIAHNPNEGYVQNVCIPEYKEFRSVYKGPLKKTAY